MQSGNVHLYAVLFQHVQQRGLPGIVESQKENFGILMIETFETERARERQRRKKYK
jgi:hypothetical protein